MILLLLLMVLGALIYGLLKLQETRARVARLESELELLGSRLEKGGLSASRRGAEQAPQPQAVGPHAPAPPAGPRPAVEAAEPGAPPLGTPPEPPEPEVPEPPRAEPAAPPPVAPAPAPPPATPTPAAAAPPRPPLRIDWEQWIGVKGAALLGGIVLALAVVLFLKFSIERGLIPPIVRVALGILAGVAALVGSELLRRRYETTANSLAGAGIVILYASVWAARALYGLIPSTLAFSFTALVTVACGLLSFRHGSQVIGVLGLIGGFASPLLLASPANRPIGLFGYILLLDVGLLALARKRGWPLLALLGLGGTALYQLIWISAGMDPGQAVLGLIILAVFALVFAAAGGLRPADEDRRTWRLTSGAAVFLPFLFAAHLAVRADLDVAFWQLGMLLTLLSAAALRLGKLHAQPLLGTGAAGAMVGVFAVWIFRTWLRSGFTSAQSWEVVGVVAALALLFHFLGRQEPSRSQTTLAEPAFVATCGSFALLVLASAIAASSFWPWLVAWLLLAGLLTHQGRAPARGHRSVVAAAGLAAGFLLFFSFNGSSDAFPDPPIFFGLAVAVAVALQFLAARKGGGESVRTTEIAAATFPLALLGGILVQVEHPSLGPAVFLATTTTLAFLVALTATRSRLGGLYPTAVGVLALAHTDWVMQHSRAGMPPSTATAVLLTLAAIAALFTFWPFLAGRGFAGNRWALYGSALAAPAWFLALRRVWKLRFEDSAIGALPVALGLVVLAAALLARRSWQAQASERKRSLVWYLAVALGFVTLAIPLQLDKEWVTIGWAVQGLAMILLWSRLDHPGLKYLGLALLAAVSVRLLLNPAVLGYYEKSSWPIFNWLMYTYLVPASALFGSANLLARLELKRARPWGTWWTRPLGSAACGSAGLLVVFAWINLTILDYFSSGGYLRLVASRLPARDLTLSLAWTVYALVLLAIGMGRKTVSLRWASLAFLILTIGKVFLYDLGELKDLYRVASLVGLAVSLLLVSLAYQRFVFAAKKTDGEAG